MGQDGRAAGDGRGDAGQVEGGQLADAGDGRDDAGGHGHGHGGGTDADADQHRHQEGQHHQRQAHGGDGRADQVAQAGVLQDVPQHAAAGGDQHDQAGGFEGFGHQVFQLLHGVAVAQAQDEHGDDGGDQHGHERLTQEAEQDRDEVVGGQHHAADRVADDEEQRDHDDAHDGGEVGQFGLVDVLLFGQALGDGDHVLFAAEAAPDGAGHDHGDGAAEDADQDDPAQVHPQHGGHQNGAGRGRDEGVTDGQAGQQRHGVEQGRASGPLGQREGQRDENDEAGVEEDRHGHDQAGDAQGPGGLLVAEAADHRDGQGLRATRRLKDGAEH